MTVYIITDYHDNGDRPGKRVKLKAENQCSENRPEVEVMGWDFFLKKTFEIKDN